MSCTPPLLLHATACLPNPLPMPLLLPAAACSGVGFAIPVDLVRASVEQIIEYGKVCVWAFVCVGGGGQGQRGADH